MIGTPMRIAIVGCGFVADLYMKTLKLHPQLQLVGVTDRDATRLARFADFHRAKPFDSLDALLATSGADVVLNLTNPRSHFDITRQCLDVGKHVYSEKPLAMEIDQAKQLVDLAKSKRTGIYAFGAAEGLLLDRLTPQWRNAYFDHLLSTDAFFAR